MTILSAADMEVLSKEEKVLIFWMEAGIGWPQHPIVPRQLE